MICIGDVHGQLEKLKVILPETGLMDESGAWCGIFFSADGYPMMDEQQPFFEKECSD